ncbi:hypothetical protein CN897_24405 [Bacillus toyonensis]|nr:hypothetical protein CN897_24405 [Bacillus toyonensis]
MRLPTHTQEVHNINRGTTPCPSRLDFEVPQNKNFISPQLSRRIQFIFSFWGIRFSWFDGDKVVPINLNYLSHTKIQIKGIKNINTFNIIPIFAQIFLFSIYDKTARIHPITQRNVVEKIEAPNNEVNMILYLTLIRHIINKIGIKIDMLIFILLFFIIISLSKIAYEESANRRFFIRLRPAFRKNPTSEIRNKKSILFLHKLDFSKQTCLLSHAITLI